MKKIGYWIEAMRLRTLPVSLAGVAAGVAYALMDNSFKAAPAILCAVFAVLAQIASNFANEYFDFKAGLDRVGREGPRRGVTEGDITPGAMKAATFITLGLACCVGLSLIVWGGWWLLAAGAVIALGALGYSAGPYPFSHHALGEIAVIVFFGLIPVNLTFYLQSGVFSVTVLIGSAAFGLMIANVLLVNNYRDLEDDAAVGKRTLAVVAGRGLSSSLYLTNGWIGAMLTAPDWLSMGVWWTAVPASYLLLHTMLWCYLINRRGARLNPLLGMTAVLTLCYALLLMTAAALSGGC